MQRLIPFMTLEKLKSEVEALPEEQQSHLAAYLVHLRHSRDPQFKASVASQIDDKSVPWISTEQLKEHWKE